jgi:hypothetical protein
MGFSMLLLFVLATQDLSTVELDMNGFRRMAVPLSAIVLQRPDDGMPSTSDWLTTCVSFIFSGSRLSREPLDLNAGVLTCDDKFLYVKKGFTRLMLGLKLSQALINCSFMCKYVWKRAVFHVFLSG